MITHGKSILVPLFAGALILSSLCTKANSETKNNHTSKIMVAVTKVAEEKMPQTYSTFGTLSADKIVTISPTTDGRVTEVHFKNGQLVSKGTPIIQMDDTDAKAVLATKKANLALAETTYQRHKQLFAYGGDTKQNLDQLAAEVKNDNIAVTNSNILLENLTLKAPFDGQLGEFQVHAGDYVSAGDPLVTIVNKTPIKAAYSLPQSFITKLKMRQKVQITTESMPGKIFDGSVSFISPSVDPNTGTFSLEATLPNKQGALAPGMFVQVLQTIGDTNKALVIPETALLSDIEGNYVYRVVHDKAARTNVTIGTIQDGKIQIMTGLKVGEPIISQGQQKVNDGDNVSVVPDTFSANKEQ
jgi:membrane fusion protein (multidrug efflux system)